MPTTEKLLAQMFGNNARTRLLALFFLHPDVEFRTVSSINRETGLAHQTIRLAVQELASLGLLDVFSTGQSKIIRVHENSALSTAFSQFIAMLKEVE